MIKLGWVRSNINRQLARLRQMFKWAAGQELIPGTIYHALLAVEGLRAGRSDAAEAEPVRPVDDAVVRATIGVLSDSLAALIDADTAPLPMTATPAPRLTPAELEALAAKVPGESHVAAMVMLQRLTGMRPAEVCGMRTGDLDTTGTIWLYRPLQHKTRHHGHTRSIAVGPRAQRLLKPFLQLDLAAPVFSPAVAEDLRSIRLRAHRATPLTPSQAARKKRRHRRRPPGAFYTVDSYRRAIQRACDIAFPLSEELATWQHDVDTWRNKFTYKNGKAPRLKELPTDLREMQGAIEAYRKAHRWHPHQLRHTAATDLRARFGIEAAQVVLGHKSLPMTEKYAEQNQEKARQVMADAG